jgi:carbonic anhydrase
MKLNYVLIISLILLFGLSLNLTKDQTVFQYFNSLTAKKDPPVTPPAPEILVPTTEAGQSVPTTVTPFSPVPSTVPDLTNPQTVELNDPNQQISDWLSIASSKLKDTNIFPSINTNNGSTQTLHFGNLDQLTNLKFEEAQKEGAKYNGEHWFRARGGYVYYSSTKEDINVGSVYVKDAKNIQLPMDVHDSSYYCFELVDYSDAKYTLCSTDRTIKMKWLCSLQNYLKNSIDMECLPEDQRHLKNDINKVKVTQPIIIIPTASKQCNDNWNYLNNGADWECQCKDGQLQSPIDLPTKEDATLSQKSPNFQFNDFVSFTADFDTVDGLIHKGDKIKMRYDRGAIRLYHPNLGKFVQEDGAMFQAEEISFHTPSEHTIAGERFDMEMQIMGYGQTKGDIAKQVVWSFLFKKKPNHYNKFLWNLQFFELPNPGEPTIDLNTDLYLPFIFQDYDDVTAAVMKKFSFYTYEGSLTNPPCTERTTHYVTADPIPLSGTIVKLFQEALRRPDGEDSNHNLYVDTEHPSYSNRKVQPLNNRPVYIYDHIKFGCPDFAPKKVVTPVGHYEKREVAVTQYKYISGKEPSGLPHSVVVTENEAKGLPDINLINSSLATSLASSFLQPAA